MTTRINPESEFDRLRRMIAAAQEDVAEGRHLELDAISERTRRLCEHLTAIEPTRAHPYARRLKTIIGDLDALSDGIRRTLHENADQPDLASAR